MVVMGERINGWMSSMRYDTDSLAGTDYKITKRSYYEKHRTPLAKRKREQMIRRVVGSSDGKVYVVSSLGRYQIVLVL